MSQFSVNLSPIIFNPNTRQMSVLLNDEDEPNRKYSSKDLFIFVDDGEDYWPKTEVSYGDRAANPDRWGEGYAEESEGTALQCKVLTLNEANAMLDHSGFRLDPEQVFERGRPHLMTQQWFVPENAPEGYKPRR